MSAMGQDVVIQPELPVAGAPVLRAEDLRVSFRVGKRRLVAVDGVNLSVYQNETLAIVGESGSGKSTTARALVRAYEPDSGRILFDGTDITHLSERSLRPIRRRMQMVAQDPYASLDPRMQIREIIAEPLAAQHNLRPDEIRCKVEDIIAEVGLGVEALDRRPAEFSGGQRQRISIARALIVNPDVLIADEPLSALDVSVQAQLVNLLQDLQSQHQAAYVFISHDLALVRLIADRVAVMYLGRVVEEGPTAEVFSSPQHPYTAALLSAVPTRHGDGLPRLQLRGEAPSALEPPSGCAFHPRCPIARPNCATDDPQLLPLDGARKAACFYPGDLDQSAMDRIRATQGPVAVEPNAIDNAPLPGARRADEAVAVPQSVSEPSRRMRPALVTTLMRRIGRRAVELGLTIFGVTTVLFFLLHLTGDPAVVIAGQDATPAQLALIRAQNGFDAPIVTQYVNFVGHMFTLNFGTSYQTGIPALRLIEERLVPTIGLALVAMGVNLLVSVAVGCTMGARAGTRLGRILSGLVFAAQGVPFFIMGLALIQILTVQLNILPSIGDATASAWVIPAITLAWFLAPRLTRVIAVNVASAMGQDYVRAARASGASRLATVMRHALPNGMMAAATLAATQFAFLLSGTVIVEQIFGWPGVGQLLVGAITKVDFPVVLASVFFISVFVYAINAVTDILLTLLDPRTRRA